jgi:transposase
MMRPQKPFPAGTTERMRQLLASAHSLNEYRRIQSIYFRARYGYSAVQIADMVGLKIQTIRNLHAAYLKEGEAVLRLSGKGGRHRSNLSMQEEDALLSAFEEDGKLGDMLEVGQIQRVYEQRLGRSVPNSTVYRLLHRHGWRKLAPRPQHPSGDDACITAFKKTSSGS